MDLILFDLKLKQDRRVAQCSSLAKPYGRTNTLRCVVGILEDDGHVDGVVVRDIDPHDVADHGRFWPPNLAKRWRAARDGIQAPGEVMTRAEREIVLEFVRREVYALREE